MAAWRNGGAALLLSAPVLKNSPRAYKEMNRREWTVVLASGVTLALHFACFMYAMRLTSVAAGTALVCIQGVWIVLFHTVRKVKYRRPVFIGMGIAILGALMITGFDISLGGKALLGDLLALAGGVLAAAYTLLGAVARKTLSTPVYTSTCYGTTAVVLVVFCLFTGQQLAGFDATGWLGIILLTLVAQIGGHTAMNHLLSILGPLTVSTLILLESPGAALIAALVLGQQVPLATYAGLVLILAGLVLVVRGQARPAA